FVVAAAGDGCSCKLTRRHSSKIISTQPVPAQADSSSAMLTNNTPSSATHSRDAGTRATTRLAAPSPAPPLSYSQWLADLLHDERERRSHCHRRARADQNYAESQPASDKRNRHRAFFHGYNCRADYADRSQHGGCNWEDAEHRYRHQRRSPYEMDSLLLTAMLNRR